VSLSAKEIAFATELFSGLGDISTRKMMGGLCIYHAGTIFAMAHPERGILIKGAGDFIPILKATECTQWTYTRDSGKSAAMPYWTLPDAAQDHPEAACEWARNALTHL
jgi:DNA transformation protein and related proteins